MHQFRINNDTYTIFLLQMNYYDYGLETTLKHKPNTERIQLTRQLLWLGFKNCIKTQTRHQKNQKINITIFYYFKYASKLKIKCNKIEHLIILDSIYWSLYVNPTN